MNITTRKGRWAAAIGALMVASSVAVVSTAQSASAITALPVTAVNRVAGDITGAGVAIPTGWPATAGSAITVVFPAVNTSAGTLVQSADAVLATWCGNFNGATPLLSSEVGTLAGIQANCATFDGTVLAASVDNATGNITVSGSLTGLPTGRTCQPAGGVIPCLLVVANIAQTVALAMPLVNVATVQVGGPLDPATLATTPALVANCTPTSAPPKSCPSTRQTTGAVPGVSAFPTALGGLGPASTADPLTNPATWTVGDYANTIGSTNVQICTTVALTTCEAAGPTTIAPPTGTSFGYVDTAGSVKASFVTMKAPGDYFLKVGYTTVVRFDSDPSVAIPTLGACADISGGAGLVWGCSNGAYWIAPLRVLGTQSIAFDSLVAGTVGETKTVTISGLDQWRTGTLKKFDVAGYQVGTDVAVTSNGLGVAVATGVDITYPVAKITFSGATFNGGATVSTLTLTFDSSGGVGDCVDVAGIVGACSAGQILSTTVDPGNLQLHIETPEVLVPNPDLSTIDLTDPDTWYVVSDPGTVGEVIIGDMRGSNSGFVVTVQSSDLRGSATANNNVIPAGDVWFISDATCEAWADAGEGNDPLGVPAGATAADPLADPGNSLMVDGSQEACSVAPDADGRAAGMFSLLFDVAVAARPITAVDDYTGLITITLTGN